MGRTFDEQLAIGPSRLTIGFLAESCFEVKFSFRDTDKSFMKRIDATYVAIAFSLSLLAISTALAGEELDSLFAKTSVQFKEELAELSSEWAADFEALEPETNERAPASSKSKKKTTTAKKKRISKNDSRRARFPSAVSNGFEMRVKQGEVVTSFWVVRRGNSRHDLLYASSGGSRLTRSIPPEFFASLHNAATDLPKPKGQVAKCPDSIMQINVLNDGKSEKSLTACVTEKSKSADAMRAIGNALASYVY